MCFQKQPLSQEFMGSRCFIRVCSQETPWRTGGEPGEAGALPGWPQLAPRQDVAGEGALVSSAPPLRSSRAVLGERCPDSASSAPRSGACPHPSPSLGCGLPSSLSLWLCRGHLGSQGHFACNRCQLHRTLRNCSCFICQLFFCHHTEIQLIFVN